MTLKDYIQDKKSVVSSYLQTYLKQTALPQVSPVGKWGGDGVTRILHSATQGKMLRSACIFLGMDMATTQGNSEAAIQASAAMELFHTGLLVHDDIMDQDEKRRGQDSMHIQYKKLLEKDGTKHPIKTGESFAVCLGDLSFFLGHHILSLIQPDTLSSRLTNLFSSELAKVTIAQMQDVYGGNTSGQLPQDEILAIYTYKTGRYSCALPLVAGAIIGGASEQTCKHLWKLGTSMGVLYQIKDDELNILGDPEKTGKPVGSDIREGKQTLLRYVIMNHADEPTKKKLATMYGNPDMTADDLLFIQHLANEQSTQKDIHVIVEKQEQQMTEIMTALPMSEDTRILIREFSLFITNREV